MEKKEYQAPEIEVVAGLTESFLNASDDIILPPHEFKVV